VTLIILNRGSGFLIDPLSTHSFTLRACNVGASWGSSLTHNPTDVFQTTSRCRQHWPVDDSRKQKVSRKQKEVSSA
jgi:hypothetical protein